MSSKWKPRSLPMTVASFAHGFCVLSSEVTVRYKTTEELSPDFERGFMWNDRALAVGWSIDRPILATKDAALPILYDADNNLRFGGIA